MPGPFTITPAPPLITLEDDKRQGTVAFTVKNDTTRRIRASSGLVFEEGSPVGPWLTILQPGGENEAPELPGTVRMFDLGETDTYLVKIAAPSDAVPSTHTFRLVVADETDPDDIFSESGEVTVVLNKKPEPPPPPPPFPVWIIPVVVVVLVIVIGAIFLLTRQPPPVPTATPPPPTATPPPRPFAVTSVTASVRTPTDIDCGDGRFIGDITANRAGTVTYRWELDVTNLPVESVNISASGSTTITRAMPAIPFGTHRVRLHVLTPNDIASNQVNFTLSCFPF
jgi:hypothetical protein